MMGELESKLKVRAEIARTEDASDRIYTFGHTDVMSSRQMVLAHMFTFRFRDGGTSSPLRRRCKRSSRSKARLSSLSIIPE